MGEYKPIETSYDGYRFRSRLEARWAVFFNAANIEYQYEPEGFVGMNRIPYLPDFYLPQFDIYCEVKPTDEALFKDSQKIGAAIDWGATPISSKGLILLGGIPYDPTRYPVFCALYHHKGVACTDAVFDIWNGKPVLSMEGDWWCGMNERGNIWLYFGPASYGDITSDEIPRGASVGPAYKEYSRAGDPAHINACFAKARAARFEYGESGST